MKTKDMIGEFQNELDSLTKSQSIENAKTSLLESGIFTEESIKDITEDKLLSLAEKFCQAEYSHEKQRLEIQAKIAGTYDYYIPIEQRANLFSNSKEYVILEGDTIPNTDKIAKRNYMRLDLTMPMKMVSQSSNLPLDVNYIYIGIMYARELNKLATFARYINEGVFPNDNETFFDGVINKIIENNEKSEILLTQHGEPIVMISDINNMYACDYNNFFLNFLPYVQRTGALGLIKELKQKKN